MAVADAIIKAGGIVAATKHLKSAKAHEIFDAIEHCASEAGLKAIGDHLSRALTDSLIDDGELEWLAVCVSHLCNGHRRMDDKRAIGRIVGRGRFISRRPQRSPDRLASRERRRKLGGSSALPPDLRGHYTEGHRAVLCIVAEESKRHGVCDFPLDKIATLAGVCRTTVQNALHEARRLGHIAITERPQRGRKSLTNIVRIVSREWCAWISRGLAVLGRIGSKALKTVNPTERDSYLYGDTEQTDRSQRAWERRIVAPPCRQPSAGATDGTQRDG